MIALSIQQAERLSDDAASQAPPNTNAMQLLSRRRRREASHAGGFFSTTTQFGASWISWSAGMCAKNREREREKRRKGPGVSPEYDSHSTLMRSTKPSAAMRPSAAEKGGVGGLPRLRYNTTRPCAQQAKCSEEEAFPRLQCNTTRHEATTRATSISLRTFSSKFSALGTPQSQTGTCCAARSCVHMCSTRNLSRRWTFGEFESLAVASRRRLRMFQPLLRRLNLL
jgi:hypothetical protein